MMGNEISNQDVINTGISELRSDENTNDQRYELVISTNNYCTCINNYTIKPVSKFVKYFFRTTKHVIIKTLYYTTNFLKRSLNILSFNYFFANE